MIGRRTDYGNRLVSMYKVSFDTYDEMCDHLKHLHDLFNKQGFFTIKDLNGNDDIEDILDCCGWIMKIIVRAGLALVIEEDNKYTRDLFPAYKIFSEHYPEKESDMKQAVKYAINPIDKPNEILDFLNGIGNWMINESEKWLQVYNPKKLSNMEI